MGLRDKVIKESEEIRNDRLMKLLSRRYFDYYAEHETTIESIKRFFSLSQVLEVLQNCDEDNSIYAERLYHYLEKNFDKELERYKLAD